MRTPCQLKRIFAASKKHYLEKQYASLEIALFVAICNFGRAQLNLQHMPKVDWSYSFAYSTVRGSFVCFTYHPMADMFIQTSIQPRWGVLSHVHKNFFTQCFHHIYSQVPIPVTIYTGVVWMKIIGICQFWGQRVCFGPWSTQGSAMLQPTARHYICSQNAQNYNHKNHHNFRCVFKETETNNIYFVKILPYNRQVYRVFFAVIYCCFVQQTGLVST